MLYGNEGQRVRDIIRKICADLEVDIVAGNVRLDHVHLLVSVPPQVSGRIKASNATYKDL